MFIIEGSDHVGKTTVAQKMVEMCAERAEKGIEALGSKRDVEHVLSCDLNIRPHPIRYCHMTRPNKAFNHFVHYTDMLSPYTVQDRFHLGDPAYNNDGNLTEEQLILLESWIMSQGTMILIMYTSDSAWLKSRLGEKDEMFNADKILRANNNYQRIFRGAYGYKYHVDEVYDVMDGQWPDKHVLNGWIDKWYLRIQCWLTS